MDKAIHGVWLWHDIDKTIQLAVFHDSPVNSSNCANDLQFGIDFVQQPAGLHPDAIPGIGDIKNNKRL